MQWGAGARSLAMGRAFLAVADDASATYWNPAAMVQIKQKEIMVLQATLHEQTNYSYMSFVNPTAKGGVWGVSMTRLTSGGFEKVAVKTDTQNNITSIEKIGSFTVGQQAMTFAYGKQITEKLSMGIALKRVSNSVDAFSQSFSAIDASVFNKVKKNYRFGIAVQNAVSQAPANSNDRLPLNIRVGNAYSMLNDRIILAADINSNRITGLGWNVGNAIVMRNYVRATQTDYLVVVNKVLVSRNEIDRAGAGQQGKIAQVEATLDISVIDAAAGKRVWRSQTQARAERVDSLEILARDAIRQAADNFFTSLPEARRWGCPEVLDRFH
jgi:long-subunit fatty acid transport protein